jgi:hypothetical protein
MAQQLLLYSLLGPAQVGSARVSPPWHPWRPCRQPGRAAGLLEVQAHPADQSLVIHVEDDRLGYVGHDALQLEMLDEFSERHPPPGAYTMRSIWSS